MKYLSLLFLILTSCATTESGPSGPLLRAESEYFKVVDEFSDKSARYSGLYNLLDVQATLLNTKVLDAQKDQMTRVYQWNDKKLAEEKQKDEARLNKETEVFFAFYTPDRKNDDLNKPNTQWRVFFDVDGHRYEGKINKIKTATPELVSLYPEFNRFYTPYSVVFNVPAKSIENQNSKMTVTGAVGSAVLNFNSISSDTSKAVTK